MKTAISIPDELFTLAEITAKKLGIPRSQLFTRPLVEFISLIQIQAFNILTNSKPKW